MNLTPETIRHVLPSLLREHRALVEMSTPLYDAVTQRTAEMNRIRAEHFQHLISELQKEKPPVPAKEDLKTATTILSFFAAEGNAANPLNKTTERDLAERRQIQNVLAYLQTLQA